MDAVEKLVRLYINDAGESPFEEWFDRLSDPRAQQRILARIARLRTGNPGDWKAVGEGVHELRIDHGPGYRIYFGQEGPTLVILLAGGAKSTQQRDIERAKRYWYDYEESKKAKDL
jgi:putative addiction module killer protein